MLYNNSILLFAAKVMRKKNDFWLLLEKEEIFLNDANIFCRRRVYLLAQEGK